MPVASARPRPVSAKGKQQVVVPVARTQNVTTSVLSTSIVDHEARTRPVDQLVVASAPREAVVLAIGSGVQHVVVARAPGVVAPTPSAHQHIVTAAAVDVVETRAQGAEVVVPAPPLDMDVTGGGARQSVWPVRADLHGLGFVQRRDENGRRNANAARHDDDVAATMPNL